MRALGNARVLPESGVTTARDCGSSLDLLALARAPIPSCNVAAAGDVRGADHRAPRPSPQMGGEAESIAEIDAVIDRNVAVGAGSVKLMGSGGGMTPGTSPETAAYSQMVFNHGARARQLDLPSVVYRA